MSWSRLPLALAAVLLAGCQLFALDWDRVGYDVVNYTDESLDIYYLDAGRERKIHDALDPGMSILLEVGVSQTRCTAGDLVARDSSGAEVARRTEPICDDEKWVIGTPP